ncbi:MAG: hypothetical protein ACK4ND_10270 [Cytophagaceae bacterium]
MNLNYFKNEYVEIWREDGIISTRFLNDATIDLGKAKIIVQARLNMHEGEEYPVIAYGFKLKYADREALLCMSKGNAIKHVSAGAIVVTNPVHRVLARFFLTIGKPPIQSKVFENKEDAVEWFKSINVLDSK